MAGLGHVLGGALQGIGQGMAMQAKDNLETRRATALENLRNENESKARVEQADLQDRNDSRSVGRRTSSTIAVNRAQAETQAERDRRLQGYEQSNIRLRGAIDAAQASNNAAAQAQAERLKAEVSAGQVKDVVVGADGNYVKIYNDGRTEVTQIKASPKEFAGGSGLGSDGVLGQVRGTQQPAPAATAPARPPANRPSLDSFHK